MEQKINRKKLKVMEKQEPKDVNINDLIKAQNSINELTRMLFEIQTSGLTELYEKLNKNISINKIIEDSKSFQKITSKSLRQKCEL